MADKDKILDMVKKGWNDEEIRVAIKYENYQKGWRPQTQEEEKDILVYQKYRNPEIEYESIFKPKEVQPEPTFKDKAREAVSNLANFIENTDKDDGIWSDTARVLASLITEPSAKIASKISPDNDIAQRLIEANQGYENQDPVNMGGVSLGANNAFLGASLAKDGLMMAVGLKDKKDLDQEAIKRYLATEEEIEKRKASRRTEEQNKADEERKKLLEEIKIDGFGNFVKFGYESAKDFFLDMTEAFGSEQVAQIGLDPFNLLPLGVGLSSASKGLFKRVAIGAISGAVVNAPVSGAIEYGKSMGMGQEDSSAFLKGVAGGAGIGAGFGALGGVIPAPKTKIKQDQQDKQTPINSVKSAIDAMQADILPMVALITNPKNIVSNPHSGGKIYREDLFTGDKRNIGDTYFYAGASKGNSTYLPYNDARVSIIEKNPEVRNELLGNGTISFDANGGIKVNNFDSLNSRIAGYYEKEGKQQLNEQEDRIQEEKKQLNDTINNAFKNGIVNTDNNIDPAVALAKQQKSQDEFDEEFRKNNPYLFGNFGR